MLAAPENPKQLACLRFHWREFSYVLLQTWEGWRHSLGLRLWEGLSRSDRAFSIWCVLDAPLQQRHAGQACSARQQHHRGTVASSPRGHQGRPSCCKCKDWACAVLEATAHHQGLWCSFCSSCRCGHGDGRWRVALRGRIVGASWAGSASRPGPDRPVAGRRDQPAFLWRFLLPYRRWLSCGCWLKQILQETMANRGQKREMRNNQREIRSD